MIEKIAIRNYRCFRKFDMSFDAGTTVIVGDNDAGKSTLIEAILLALTGRVQGRLAVQGISPYLINMEATEEFVAGLQTGNKPSPPAVVIELFLKDLPETAHLRGTNNLAREDACGVRICAELSADYAEEYASFIQSPQSVRLVPTEYYRVEWLAFSASAITARSVPAVASVIDATAIQLQSGVDYHLQSLLRENLDPKERVELAREYRSMREEFSEKTAVKTVNERLQSRSDALSDKKLSIGIDISSRFTWESSLAAHVDGLPFSQVGKGEQSIFKTLLAVGRRATDADTVLIEEPETHLSFANLRKLISRIESGCQQKQLIIATHSNFVLNKLGLSNLVVLGRAGPTCLSDLPPSTIAYFKKLAGYDTLRLVLCAKVVLVEGPSDELIFQRAYRNKYKKSPIEDGIDVISVGLSHKRFLDIAIRLKKRCAVLTDNDGKDAATVRARFSAYTDVEPLITVHTGEDPNSRTLEPQIVDANDLTVINKVLGTAFESKDEAKRFMQADKTNCALAVFESKHAIVMPEYILDAVDRL